MMRRCPVALAPALILFMGAASLTAGGGVRDAAAGTRVGARAQEGAPPAVVLRDGSACPAATTILLVRHAERADDGTRDPGLTDAGARRSQALAGLLVDAGVTAIHSTETRRTLATAAPLADALGLVPTHYDPGALADFADGLVALPGRHLVVGHSNTTPTLAEHLGGEGHGAIVEAWEYDRLYVLTFRCRAARAEVPGDGTAEVETLLLRYGVPSREP